MEQYENQGTQPVAIDSEASETTTQNETLETNETDNDNSTRQGDATEASSEESLNKKLEELGLDRKEYFRLKGQKDSQESNEGSQKVEPVVSDDALLGRLEARGVLDVDDQAYVLRSAKALNISPIDALNDSVVKDRLSANQKARETSAATPQSSSRSGQNSAKDTVEYWMKKSELPPKENKELRRKVMHVRNAQRTSSNMFNN